jgi:hypothetical protein
MAATRSFMLACICAMRSGAVTALSSFMRSRMACMPLPASALDLVGKGLPERLLLGVELEFALEPVQALFDARRRVHHAARCIELRFMPGPPSGPHPGPGPWAWAIPKNTALAARNPATILFLCFMLCSCLECRMAGRIKAAGCKPDVTDAGSL